MTEALCNLNVSQRKLRNEQQVEARALLLSHNVEDDSSQVLLMMQNLCEQCVVVRVCDLAKSIMKVVHECHDRAHDVLCAGEFVASQWQLFRRVCASAIKSKQNRALFHSAMGKLEPLLSELNAAVSDFKSTESFWQMMRLRAEARVMASLKDKVNVVVEDLVRGLNIAQCTDVKHLLPGHKNHFFALETFIYYLVDDRIRDRNDEAINRVIQEIQVDEVDLENIFWREVE